MKMINVIIPTFIKEKKILDDSTIQDICFYSFNEKKFTIQYEDRKDGRYIILKKNDEIHYVCLSASKKEYKGRNSFISQYLGTAFCRFKSERNTKKKMEVFLLMATEDAFLPYQMFIYRCCKTLQINLLNIHKPILPFSTFRDIKTERSRVSGKNTGNNSSYFSDTGNFIEFFAKCYGANGKEAVFMAMVVKQLTEKRVVIYQVEDHGQHSLAGTDKNVLINEGFEFGEDVPSEDFKKVNLDAPEKDLRDQPAFRLNLFKKYGDKKCYLCNCDIDSMIIASHIHRVTDIKNDKTISDDDKRKQIIDGDNGLWLCANHDKLFEYGLIYFEDKKMVVSSRLNTEQQVYVNEITTKSEMPYKEGVMVAENPTYGTCSFSIKDSDFNAQMKYYLGLHKQRALQKVNG